MKRMLWGRKWLLLFCAAVGAGIGYLQFTKVPEQFSSSARIMVERERPLMPVEGMSEIKIQDPIDTHLELIRTAVILEGAVKELEPLAETVPALARSGSPASVIAGRLRAHRSSTQSSIIDISYTSFDRDECQVVLKAVMASYKAYLGESQQDLSERMVELVSKAEGELRDELAQKELNYQKFRDTTSLLWSGEEGHNIHQQRMARVESDRAEIIIQQTQIKAELDAIESAQQRGTSREVLMLVADQINTRGGSPAAAAVSTTQQTLTGQLLPLLLEEALLMEKVGAGHPDVRQIRKKIEVTEQLLKQQAGGDGSAPLDLLALYVQSLQEELRITDQKISELNRLFIEEREAGRLLGSEENRNRVMLEDIQRTKDLYDEILDKLGQINLVKSNNNFTVRPVAEPGKGYLIGPNRERYLSMGSLGGLFVGVFLSFLLELTDRSFRSPSEIAQMLRAPVVGHIPRIDSERGSKIVKDKTIDSTVATYHRPKSRVAEAYRGVRTSLLFNLKGQNHKVVQITSPDPSDGKSTLSANVATAMALSGKKTLLIDVDLRKPRQHKIFGVSRDHGVSGVLQDLEELPDAIQPTKVDNLSILTAGPRVDHPGELLLSPRFEELLALVREQYDFIVVDSPPVLAVTDATSVAPLVDGVLVVFRISKRSRPHAMQACESLEMTGGNLLGVVVNGLGEFSSYHYGNADYGYHYSGSYYGRYDYRERETPARAIEQSHR
ncbi:MAG: polysaccharide biosynthesis tyrosine autokinase [Planctomycetaceae bacterium]|nr:polysaccharide biosynthesis tyrosine autokinase [Planctomycetaceae bacterium]